MKKNYLTPPHHVLSLMAATSMRLKGIHFKLDADGNEIEDDESGIKAMLDSIETKLSKGLDTKAANAVKTEVKALEEKITALGNKASKEDVDAVKSLAEGIQETLDLLDVKVQKLGKDGPQLELKSFNQVLAETLAENADAIKNHKKGSTLVLDMKAVGDMSIGVNFPTLGQLYDVQKPLYIPPQQMVFLGDILPGATSGGTGIVYPERNGGDGGIDEWDGTDDEDKSQVDYNFIKREITFAWLAGVVIVEREMLDDIPWLTSFLQNQLLLDLKARENAFILNRDTTGLIARATAYDGDFTVPVERLVDAAYGQLPEETFGQNRTTHFIMRPRDTVKIGLNKAAGSQEFDLPQNTIGFVNGVLNLSGIETVATTSMATGKFLAIDSRATQFVKRMAPEIRIFEDATLAKRNKLMFRIEERVALAVYNPKAIVYGDLNTAGEG